MPSLREAIETERNRRASQGFCTSVGTGAAFRQGCGARGTTKHASSCDRNTDPKGFSGLSRLDADFRAYWNEQEQQPGFWKNIDLEIDLFIHNGEK